MYTDEPLEAMHAIDPIWRSAPAAVGLLRHEVQVWCADLSVSDEGRERLRQTLSPDEEERARRFYFERDRNRFIAGRGILRSVLSRYVGLEPSELRFFYSPRGKPFLSSSEVCFNLSHSQGWALVAVALDRQVGVDLEYIRPVETLQLAKRFFSDREYATLCSLPVDRQQAAFFQAWTCKEAYLKATGDGLINLEQVEVAIGSSPLQIISPGQNGNFDDRWLLQPIHLKADYAATLALEGTQANVTFWRWLENYE